MSHKIRSSDDKFWDRKVLPYSWIIESGALAMNTPARAHNMGIGKMYSHYLMKDVTPLVSMNTQNTLIHRIFVVTASNT